MNRVAGGLVERVLALPKMRRFAIFLALTASAGAVASGFTWLAFYRTPDAPPVTVSLLVPLTGPNAALGVSMREGAEIMVAQRKSARGKTPIRLTLADATAADALDHASVDPQTIAIVGPSATDAGDETTVANRKIPQLALAGPQSTLQNWSQALSPDRLYEARYLANYVRNVKGEKLVSIIVPDDPSWASAATAFDETLQRFGTKVVYRWSIPFDSAARRAALDAAARDMIEKQVAGVVLVLGDPQFSAEAVSALGAAKVNNHLIGLRELGSSAFREAMGKVWRGPGAVSQALNQTLFTTPMLFDMASAAAQTFQNAYTEEHARAPDWAAALAYDGVHSVAAALDAQLHQPGDTADLRDAIHTEFARHDSPATALPGLADPIYFGARSGSAVPIHIGRYDGDVVVAAETQLTPIRDVGVSDYLEQLTGGKALYVNDRFMYKTNVVATGIRLNKISDPKPSANSVDLDFSLWFRWRGSLAANDIIFENAVQPIPLGTPERSQDDGDQHYRAWRVRGKFFLNVSSLGHPYGTQMVSIAFRHRALGRNNLMYVADVVGMGLAAPTAAHAMSPSLLERLFGSSQAKSSGLVRQLNEARVMAGAPGWIAEQALFSQDLTQAGTDGDPAYVGYGKPAPVFSRVSMDVRIRPDAIDLRSLLSQSVIVYVAIFSLSGALLAHILDRRDRGQFWRMQTLVLRLITWPLLLATVSSLVLDYMVENSGLAEITAVDFIVSSLWWLVPARLLALTVERFVWVPLQARTGRRIPTVFRMSTSGIIYMLAGFGIVSFVLERPITSLLATSGLLTLIFGLAVQSNLKDIFSGIMLNLERPFVLNDWVRINKVEAQVHDISWRTTRLRTRRGQIIALANGRVVEAEIENLTKAGFYEATCNLFMDPRCPPSDVLATIKRAIDVVASKSNFRVYKVQMSRVDNFNGTWASRYQIDLEVDDIKLRSKVIGALWPALWNELAKSNLTWGLTPHNVSLESEALEPHGRNQRSFEKTVSAS